MGKSFSREFLETFNELKLPESLAVRFDALECLSENEHGETYKLAEKDGGKRFVLKRLKKSETADQCREAEFLSGLKHKGLPVFEPEVYDGDSLFILREYIEGMPLDKYLYERLPNEARIINIAIELCDILSYLHSRKPPIIHRDIKPSNIIVGFYGNEPKLIDFGISRRYSGDADKDTAFFGTHKFAPPEQYGFSQTDCRADIYALGTTLRFMLTGKTDGRIEDKGLTRIVDKCTAFSPKDRYSGADAVKRSLIKHKNRVRRNSPAYAAVASVIYLVFISGFIIGRYTDLLNFPRGGAKLSPESILGDDNYALVPVSDTIPDAPKAPGDGVYTFTDSLVEKTVRAMLNKADGDAVYREELNTIEHLCFYGDNVVPSVEEYRRLRDSKAHGDPYTIGYGSLKDLTDLQYMDNLNWLVITQQPIYDLTPLIGLPWLWGVELRECHSLTDISPLADCAFLDEVQVEACGVTDFSSLAGLQTMRVLRIYHTPNVDLSCFEGLKQLRELVVANVPLKTIAELGDLSHLSRLGLNDAPLSDLSGIENFTSLTWLNLEHCRVSDFSPLETLPGLKEIVITPNMQQYSDTYNRDDIQITIRD